MKSKFLIATMSLLLANIAYSDLAITINNQTQGNCLLSNVKMLQGALVIPPPLSIFAKQSKTFHITQFEPDQQTDKPIIDAVLSYTCGLHSIQFEMTQYQHRDMLGLSKKASVQLVDTQGIGLTQLGWQEESVSMTLSDNNP